VNLLHLEIFHHSTSDTSKDLFLDDTAIDTRPKLLEYAFSLPFLMHEILAMSSLHLSTIHPSSPHLYRRESTTFQASALKLFNKSVKEVTDTNLIPAFLFAGIFGLHFFCDIFSTPSSDLDHFLDRLVQSIKIWAGVRAVIAGR
jgi:hypothetical protein